MHVRECVVCLFVIVCLSTQYFVIHIDIGKEKFGELSTIRQIRLDFPHTVLSMVFYFFNFFEKQRSYENKHLQNIPM